MSKIIICSPSVYKYENWVFEIHSYFGPCPLDDDGTPYSEIPDEFWKMYYDKFDVLSDDEQKEYMMFKGGCLEIK